MDKSNNDSEWFPIEGKPGFFAKNVQAPNMSDPTIRRVVEELQRQFAAIDEDVDKHSQKKYKLKR